MNASSSTPAVGSPDVKPLRGPGIGIGEYCALVCVTIQHSRVTTESAATHQLMVHIDLGTIR
jgi:hypothetical protein